MTDQHSISTLGCWFFWLSLTSGLNEFQTIDSNKKVALLDV